MKHRKNNWKENSVNDMWDNIKRSKIHVTRFSVKERERERERKYISVYNWNFPILTKNKTSQVCDTSWTLNRINTKTTCWHFTSETAKKWMKWHFQDAERKKLKKNSVQQNQNPPQIMTTWMYFHIFVTSRYTWQDMSMENCQMEMWLYKKGWRAPECEYL